MSKTLKTNAQVLGRLYQRGSVEMPVLGKHDVMYILVQKQDLISRLKQLGPNEPCPWQIISDSNGIITLDTANV